MLTVASATFQLVATWNRNNRAYRQAIHNRKTKHCTARNTFAIRHYSRHYLTLTFRSLSETFVRRSLCSSSSSSCHGSDVTWQEIGRMCGSVCSCHHHGSLNAVPSFNKLLLTKVSDRDRNVEADKDGLCCKVIYI